MSLPSLQRATSRRNLLGGAALGSLGLGVTQLIGAAPVPPVTAQPWDDGDLPAVAGARRRMSAAAAALLATLTTEQHALVFHRDLGDADRTKWSNFPAGASPRPGVPIGDLTDGQRIALHDLLRASTSSQGYHKMTGAIRADDALHDQNGEPLFGAAHYYVTVFGSPEDTAWAWMLTGHHMSAVFTVSGERIAFTPMFTGAQPLQIPKGTYAGWQVLPNDARLAGDLLASLSDDQRRVAVIGSSSPGDVLSGPGRQNSLRTFAGIASTALDGPQQRLLWRLVQEFVCCANFEAVENQLALVRAGWAGLHFAWLGPDPGPSVAYYFRVHGPRILIEYDVQQPLDQDGGHVHAITRDPANDYGIDWLGLHYQEPSPHPGGGPGGHGPPGPGGPPRGAPPSGASTLFRGGPSRVADSRPSPPS